MDASTALPSQDHSTARRLPTPRLRKNQDCLLLWLRHSGGDHHHCDLQVLDSWWPRLQLLYLLSWRWRNFHWLRSDWSIALHSQQQVASFLSLPGTRLLLWEATCFSDWLPCSPTVLLQASGVAEFLLQLRQCVLPTPLQPFRRWSDPRGKV